MGAAGAGAGAVVVDEDVEGRRRLRVSDGVVFFSLGATSTLRRDRCGRWAADRRRERRRRRLGRGQRRLGPGRRAARVLLGALAEGPEVGPVVDGGRHGPEPLVDEDLEGRSSSSDWCRLRLLRGRSRRPLRGQAAGPRPRRRRVPLAVDGARLEGRLLGGQHFYRYGALLEALLVELRGVLDVAALSSESAHAHQNAADCKPTFFFFMNLKRSSGSVRLSA